jgi:hypothetical protein
MIKLIISLSFLATSAFAVEVKSATFDYVKSMVRAELTFGGCGVPAFKLKFDNRCFETDPMQSRAQVIQTAGDDGCERLNHKTVLLSIKESPCGYEEQVLSLRGTTGRSVQVHIGK